MCSSTSLLFSSGTGLSLPWCDLMCSSTSLLYQKLHIQTPQVKSESSSDSASSFWSNLNCVFGVIFSFSTAISSSFLLLVTGVFFFLCLFLPEAGLYSESPSGNSSDDSLLYTCLRTGVM